MNEIVIATNVLSSYTNTLLALLLPAVADFAQKLDLPERTCTVADVRHFQPFNHTVGGWITFKNGNQYLFDHGYVDSFRSAHSYFALQNPELIPTFYGPVRMTTNEVVQLARSVVTRLGYSEEVLYTDLQPEIATPATTGTNVVPHFRVAWPCPNAPARVPTVEIEINSNTRAIENIYFLSRALEKQLPVLPGVTITNIDLTPLVTPSEAQTFTAAVLPKITCFAKALDLPFPYPITTNHIASISVYQEPHTKLGEIRLLNGFTFTAVEDAVIGFAAPDEFFNWRQIKLKDFVGKWNITELQAIASARRAVTSVGVPQRLVAGQPDRVDRPFGSARDQIPRCRINWSLGSEHSYTAVMVEVDACSNTIKAIHLL